MTKIKEFINSIENENTAKVAKHVLGNVEDTIELFSLEKLEKYIWAMKPNSQKAITTICYVIGMYAKWLKSNFPNEKNDFLKIVSNVDKKKIWKQAKPMARKKFVSCSDFRHVINETELYEEFNSLYYKTLFRCIYEGIYCEDMSVIKNLRRSDVHGNIVTLKEDNGNIYDLEISPSLAADIIKLSYKEKWERRNRYGICKVEMCGIYNDSVFKVEYRSTANAESSRFCYYSKLRKMCAEYLYNHITPLQLYISGIMNRIVTEFKHNNIKITDAMGEYNRNKYYHNIIENELIRSNYGSNYGNFIEIVKGHLDVFEMVI